MEPIFIIGAPRSGTTLLAQLLKDTPYGQPIETHFIVKCYNRLKKYGDFRSKQNVDKLLDDILSERAIMQRRLNVHKEKFYSSLKQFTYTEIVDRANA